MSPTSYQAAPPRTTTIAEQSNSVKFVANRLPFLVLSFSRSRSFHHQLVYAVPSIAVPSQPECTSSTPVLVWSGLNTVSPICGTQSF